MVGIPLTQLQCFCYVGGYGLTGAAAAIFQTADMAGRAVDQIGKLFLAEAVYAAPEFQEAAKQLAGICGSNLLLLTILFEGLYGSHAKLLAQLYSP
jgi:hypothetical protein